MVTISSCDLENIFIQLQAFQPRVVQRLQCQRVKWQQTARALDLKFNPL